MALSRCILLAIQTCVVLQLAWGQSPKWEVHSAIANARHDRDNSIAWARKEAAQIDSEEYLRISALPFERLRDDLQSGAISAETALRVQIASALIQHDKTNSVVQFFEESIDEARLLDELAKSPDYKKPSLFGLPLSVKENVAVKNQRCSIGLSTSLGHKCYEDSYTIERLRDSGMVPFCQTNSVYGLTMHPLDSRRSSGGSSGGEAALIAGSGSRIGIGSDVGGSIRVPAAYSGCAGFKPSSTRMSQLKASQPVPFRPFLVPIEGPLGESPQAIVEVMRALWSEQFFSMRDAFSVPLNFQDDIFASNKKLRIGYFVSDGFINPLPSMHRTVLEAADALKARGHELVPFSMEDIPRQIYLGVAAAILSESSKDVSNVAAEDVTYMQEDTMEFGKKSWEKKLIALKSTCKGEKKIEEILDAMPLTAMDAQRGIVRISSSRKRLILSMKEHGIDALMSPPTYSPATTHEFLHADPLLSLLWNDILSTLWNALDMPAGVVPFGHVTEEDEEALESFQPEGTIEHALKINCAESVGLPLAVQFVAPPYRDEVVLRLMCELHTQNKK